MKFVFVSVLLLPIRQPHGMGARRSPWMALVLQDYQQEGVVWFCVGLSAVSAKATTKLNLG